MRKAPKRKLAAASGAMLNATQDATVAPVGMRSLVPLNCIIDRHFRPIDTNQRF
ncbi:MAG: hypothetical protein RBJ76_28555 [Stenomitos frigidus ULC029]